jgi:TRAP transporter 4TM/12TM fusion protein
MAVCLINGAKGILSVSCACSTAGIIVGIVTMSGLGLKLGEGLLSLTKGHLMPTLFFTMVTSLILGMGVPTTANYLITSTIAAPILVRLGIPLLPSHLFVFYFGILSDITPPVALAAYAGAAIAKANPFKTGVIASKLAVAAFLVPYMFVLNSQMLLIDVSFFGMIQVIATSIIGMIGIGSALTGYLLTDTAWYERIVLVISGILLVYPGYTADVLGGVIFCIIYMLQKKKQRMTVNTK